MKNKINVLIVSLLLLIGFNGTISQKVVQAVDTSRIHFEFRWYSPYDTSYRQQKWTKSGYHLKSNTVTIPFLKHQLGGIPTVQVEPVKLMYLMGTHIR